jgi:hypothetical protein
MHYGSELIKQLNEAYKNLKLDNSIITKRSSIILSALTISCIQWIEKQI